jgi:phospholipase/carboxylesterase
MRHTSTPEQEDFVGLRFLSRAGESPEAPLVVLVHGRAGSREVIWTFERSLPPAVAVVSFQAFLPDSVGGWSWWQIEGSAEERAQGAATAAARLTESIERFIELYDLRPRALLGIGFSQGSALLSRVLLEGRVPFAGLAFLAGFVVREASIAEAQAPVAAVQPSIFMAHGSADEETPIARARADAQYLRSRGMQVEFVEDPVAHKVGVQGTRQLKVWAARVCGCGE